MDQNWKFDFQNNPVKKACIHEAGHIIVAKAINCQVLSTKVLENGDGATEIHYGDLNPMVKALSNHNNELVCMYSRQDEFSYAVNKYILILLAGHIAEFLYEKNFQSSELESVIFEGKDSADIKYISDIYGLDSIQSSSCGTSAILHENKQLLENIALKIYEKQCLSIDEIQILTNDVVNPLK